MVPDREYWLSPQLALRDYFVTSDETDEYDCAAWAVGDTEQNWWPGYPDDYHWPEPESEDTVDYFVDFFTRSLGYEECYSTAFEPGFQKIAIFARHGNPTMRVTTLSPQSVETFLRALYLSTTDRLDYSHWRFEHDRDAPIAKVGLCALTLAGF